jgi:hypothetical protein
MSENFSGRKFKKTTKFLKIETWELWGWGRNTAECEDTVPTIHRKHVDQLGVTRGTDGLCGNAGPWQQELRGGRWP